MTDEVVPTPAPKKPRKPRAPRKPKVSPVLELIPDPAAAVRLKCVTFAKPWVDGSPIEFGDIIEIDPDLAALLIRNGHAEII